MFVAMFYSMDHIWPEVWSDNRTFVFPLSELNMGDEIFRDSENTKGEQFF